jgi:predicted AAA+ superfamily ATPase
MALFDGEELPGSANLSMRVPEILERIVVGGWPSLLEASVGDAQQWLDDYLYTIVHRDLPDMGTGRDPDKVRRLLAALGRGNGTAISVSTLVSDVNGADGTASRATIGSYITALRRLMLTEDMPAFNDHMRAKTRLRKDPTRFMVDPSLAVAALGQGPDQLLRDLNATGFHFENLAVRDLRIYSQPLRGELTHWRDINNNEVDAVIQLRDGRWAAFEVKLGTDRIDAGAAALINFEKKVDVSRIGAPVFKAVLTGTGASYLRPDGVMVIPLTTLGP